MVMVDIYPDIYEKAKKVILNKKLEYPTLQNFVNKAVEEKVKIESIRKEEQK